MVSSDVHNSIDRQEYKQRTKAIEDDQITLNCRFRLIVVRRSIRNCLWIMLPPCRCCCPSRTIKEIIASRESNLRTRNKNKVERKRCSNESKWRTIELSRMLMKYAISSHSPTAIDSQCCGDTHRWFKLKYLRGLPFLLSLLLPVACCCWRVEWNVRHTQTQMVCQVTWSQCNYIIQIITRAESAATASCSEIHFIDWRHK